MTTDRERLSRLRSAWNRAAITEANRTRRRIAYAAVDALDDVLDALEDK